MQFVPDGENEEVGDDVTRIFDEMDFPESFISDNSAPLVGGAASKAARKKSVSPEKTPKSSKDLPPPVLTPAQRANLAKYCKPSTVQHLVNAWRYNSFGHHTEDGVVLFNRISMCAHGCDPSCCWTYGEKDTFVLRSRINLKANQELSISYLQVGIAIGKRLMSGMWNVASFPTVSVWKHAQSSVRSGASADHDAATCKKFPGSQMDQHLTVFTLARIPELPREGCRSAPAAALRQISTSLPFPEIHLDPLSLQDDDLLKSTSARREKLENWKFTCGCARCMLKVDLCRGFRCLKCRVGSHFVRENLDPSAGEGRLGEADQPSAKAGSVEALARKRPSTANSPSVSPARNRQILSEMNNDIGLTGELGRDSQSRIKKMGKSGLVSAVEDSNQDPHGNVEHTSEVITPDHSYD